MESRFVLILTLVTGFQVILLTWGQNLADVFSNMALKCPCVLKIGEPEGIVTAADINACAAYALATPGSTGIDYCAMAKACKVFNADNLEYYFRVHQQHPAFTTQPPAPCSRLPQPDAANFFLIARGRRQTTDCDTLKKEGKTTSDYYKVSIRGKVVTVYCRMDYNPARTYYDLASSVKYQSAPEITWTKVRLTYDDCHINILTTDFVYSSNPGKFISGSNGYGEAILRGGAAVNRPGWHSLDLTSTPFRFTPWFAVKHRSYEKPAFEELRNYTSRYSFFTGSIVSPIGTTDVRPYATGTDWEFGHNVTLQLHS